MGVASSSGQGFVDHSEARLVDVLNTSGIGIWTWDLASDAINWSLPGSDGLTEMDVVLASSAELLALARAEDRRRLGDALQAVAEEGRNLDVTFQIEGVSARVIRIEAKRFLGPPSVVVGIARDDTEQARSKKRMAALFDERDRVARALETALLPPALPEVPGLTVDAAYRTGEGASTGDFYDLFPIDGGDWALSIGDVGGHGPAAAAITTSVRYSMRAAGLVRRSPARVLRAANTTHLAAAQGERFTTCHFVRMRRSGDGLGLRVGTAGHPDMLIRRMSGKIERLSGSGPMLGLMRKPQFVDVREVLGVGDVLVACTDGVAETRRGAAFFGEDGVASFLSAWSGTMDGFAEALHDEAESFNDGAARDDMATVAIRVEELPANVPHEAENGETKGAPVGA